MSSSQQFVQDHMRQRSEKSALECIKTKLAEIEPSGAAYVVSSFNELSRLLDNVPMTARQRDGAVTHMRGIGYLLDLSS